MQLVGALWGLATGGGAAAAGGAAAGAASGLTALQAAGSIFGAVATIGQGFAARRQANAEAREQEFQAREEYVAGKETSAALKNELARTIGNQAVAFAAGGVDLGSVSVGQAKNQAASDAENELGIASNQALSRSLARRRAAANSRAQGRAALFSSFVGAGQQLIDTEIDIRERGV